MGISEYLVFDPERTQVPDRSHRTEYPVLGAFPVSFLFLYRKHAVLLVSGSLVDLLPP